MWIFRWRWRWWWKGRNRILRITRRRNRKIIRRNIIRRKWKRRIIRITRIFWILRIT